MGLWKGNREYFATPVQTYASALEVSVTFLSLHLGRERKSGIEKETNEGW